MDCRVGFSAFNTGKVKVKLCADMLTSRCGKIHGVRERVYNNLKSDTVTASWEVVNLESLKCEEPIALRTRPDTYLCAEMLNQQAALDGREARDFYIVKRVGDPRDGALAIVKTSPPSLSLWAQNLLDKAEALKDK